MTRPANTFSGGNPGASGAPVLLPAASVEVLAEANVVVCGGGCSGVAAAVAAARRGASVILIERWPSVGGMPAFCGRNCGGQSLYARRITARRASRPIISLR